MQTESDCSSYVPDEESNDGSTDSDIPLVRKRKKIENVKKALFHDVDAVDSKFENQEKISTFHEPTLENAMDEKDVLENTVLEKPSSPQEPALEATNERGVPEETVMKNTRARTDLQKKVKSRNKHPFINSFRCQKKNCCSKFTTDERKFIYEQFWNMNKEEQKTWMYSKIKETGSKRKVEGSKRSFTRRYYFVKNEETIEVCQKYFLNTLGYNSTTVLQFLLKSCKDDHGIRLLIPRKDQRGRHKPPNKVPDTPIRNHITSFDPKPSHYRRSHAPNRKYLPPGLTIKYMFEDFKEKNDTSIYYEKYRRVIDEMNIGFYDVEADKCGFCIEKDMNQTEDNINAKEAHLQEVSNYHKYQ